MLFCTWTVFHPPNTPHHTFRQSSYKSTKSTQTGISSKSNIKSISGSVSLGAQIEARDVPEPWVARGGRACQQHRRGPPCAWSVRIGSAGNRRSPSPPCSPLAPPLRRWRSKRSDTSDGARSANWNQESLQLLQPCLFGKAQARFTLETKMRSFLSGDAEEGKERLLPKIVEKWEQHKTFDLINTNNHFFNCWTIPSIGVFTSHFMIPKFLNNYNFFFFKAYIIISKFIHTS